MKRIAPLTIANSVALVITLAVNFISQSPDLLGVPYTVGELGESRAIFFLPAGYVFGIWGIIYTGLIAFIIYQALPANRDKAFHEQINVWFIVTCAANSAWLVLFLNNALPASTVAMLILLGALLIIYQRLHSAKSAVTRGERWCVHIPFSIYLGWISVATIANIAAMLHDAGFVTVWAGISADAWAIIMMLAAAVLSALMLFRRRDTAYAFVVVWSLVGIYARPFDTAVFAPLSGLNAQIVQYAALGLAVVVMAVIALSFARRTGGLIGKAAS